MAVNKESNSYTFLFSIAMVVLVGSLLTFISLALKPFQNKNDADKKKMDILAAIGVEEVTRTNAAGLYQQHVIGSKVLTYDGRDTLIIDSVKDATGKVITDTLTAFEIDVKKDFRDKKLANSDKYYPLFIAKNAGGDTTFHVIPMVGKGLWGPIWGYIALLDDNITIAGASFDHKSETPGLGAEIKEAFFESPWKDKKIFTDNGRFVSVRVKKGGGSGDHEVNAITGGTITSNGVDEMAKRTLGIYRNYLRPKP